MTSSAIQTSALLRDRIIVSVGAVIWIVGTLFGTGLIGDSAGVQEQGEGLFSDSATLIAPAGPAFSIWSVIYLFLAAYIVWQWLPTSSRSRWAAVTRIPAAASLALNGLWLFAAYLGWLGVSVLVMIGIVVSLGWILKVTADLVSEGIVTDIVVSVTFGLYLGWITVATCANIASWLVGLGVEAEGTLATIVTIVVLAVAVALARFLLWRTRQRVFQVAFAAAVTWGISWVAVGRLSGDLVNQPVGYAAAVAAVVVVVLAVLRVVRTPRPARP